ncbi:MAG: transcriptional repressor LexA [Planctomycetota bacterium]|nr:transcriptional repressor LexA [Planctomycetota bacterium]
MATPPPPGHRSTAEPAPTGTRAQVLDVIRIGAQHGRPATVREIATQLGLSSPASVHRHLRRLEQSGFICRDPRGGSRRWRPVPGTNPTAPDAIPIVGTIAAGEPIESCTDGGSQPHEWLQIAPQAFGASGVVVALKVEGMSMQDAGILSGDLAIVRRQPTVENGEIAAVTVDGQGTLKSWRIESARRGRGSRRRIQLKAANSEFEDIEVDPEQQSIEVFGKLVGVIRHFDRR